MDKEENQNHDEGQEGQEPQNNQGSPNGQNDKSLADVVKEAVNKRDDSSGSSPDGEDDEADASSGEGNDSEEDGSAEAEPLSLEKVTEERDNLKSELEAARPHAETAKALSDFCSQNGITQEDLHQALEFAALKNADPNAFRDRIRELSERYDVAQGARLPDDLRKKVDDGLMDEDSAKELAKARVELDAAKGQSSSMQNTVQRDIAGALDQWEAQTKSRDPDYEKHKKPFLEDRLQALMVRRPPQTVSQAMKLVEQAYKEVNERVSQFVPKPKPTKKALTSDRSSKVNGKGDEKLRLDDLDRDLGPIVRKVARESLAKLESK